MKLLKLRKTSRCFGVTAAAGRADPRNWTGASRRRQEKGRERESELRPSQTERHPEPRACSGGGEARGEEWCWKDSSTILGSAWLAACRVRAHACVGRGARGFGRSPSYLIIGCHLSTPHRRSRQLTWRRRTRSDPAAASAAPLENKRTSGLGCGCSESGGPYGLIPEIIQARWIPALQGLSGRIWIQHLKLTSNLTARADWNELGTYLCSLHKKQQQYNSELFCKHEIWLKQLWIFSNLLNSVFSKINILVSWLSVSVDSFPSVHSNLPVNNEVRGRTSAAHRLTNSKQMWRISHLCC